MPNATYTGGSLAVIPDCYIIIPVERFEGNRSGSIKIEIDNLPEISDSKSSAYNDEAILGRSFPLKTFSHSENRSINFQLHLYTNKPSDVQKNILYMRAIQSACYPIEGDVNNPFIPPPVCRIKCGKLLSDRQICVVLKNYNVKFATDVVWSGPEYWPIKVDIDTTWDLVYTSSALPGQTRILVLGS